MKIVVLGNEEAEKELLNQCQDDSVIIIQVLGPLLDRLQIFARITATGECRSRHQE